MAPCRGKWRVGRCEESRIGIEIVVRQPLRSLRNIDSMTNSRFLRLLMCLPPIIAAFWSWSYAYRKHWKEISEQDAVRMAQLEMVRHVKQMRVEGWNLPPPEHWRLTETNVLPKRWSCFLQVTDPQVGLRSIYYVASRGSNGWEARIEFESIAPP